MVQISTFLDHPYTLKKKTHIANFSILTPEQTKHMRPVNPTSVRDLLNNNHDDAIHYIVFLKIPKLMKSMITTGFQSHKTRARRKNIRPFGHVFSELWDLEQLEQLNPLEDTNSRDQFLSNFDWTDSTLQPDAN